jgi:hypothetical protein
MSTGKHYFVEQTDDAAMQFAHEGRNARVTFSILRERQSTVLRNLTRTIGLTSSGFGTPPPAVATNGDRETVRC